MKLTKFICRNLFWAALCTSIFSCSDSTDDTTDTEQEESQEIQLINAVVYDDITFDFSSAMEQHYEAKDFHSKSRMHLGDAAFSLFVDYGFLVNVQRWVPVGSSVHLTVTLFAPGEDGLTDGTYEFMPDDTDEDDAQLANTRYFTDGRIGFDLNNTDDREYFDVTGGTLTLKATDKGYELSFNFTLENGETTQGHYSGEFADI